MCTHFICVNLNQYFYVKLCYVWQLKDNKWEKIKPIINKSTHLGFRLWQTFSNMLTCKPFIWQPQLHHAGDLTVRVEEFSLLDILVAVSVLSQMLGEIIGPWKDLNLYK